MKDGFCDLLIVGGGFAGLTAACAASEAGLDVVVTEKNNYVGGSAAVSAGMIWCPSTYRQMRDYIPDGDEGLQRILCGHFADSIAWLENLGLPLLGEDAVGEIGRGRAMALGASGDRHQFMGLFGDLATKHGGRLFTGTATIAVRPRPSGGYRATIRDKEGEGELSAGAVVLASGGFQASKQLIAKYVGKHAVDALMLRTDPSCTGDGLTIASQLGAAIKGRMDSFYGHTMPDIDIPCGELQGLTAYFARHAVAINKQGVRFADEGYGAFEETLSQDGWKQPDGVFFLVFDDKIYHRYGIDQKITSAVPAMDRLQRWRELGASVYRSTSLENLAEQLQLAEKVPADIFMREISQYNERCRAGLGGSLQPRRSGNPLPISSGRFYAVRCRSSISLTSGGIAVDGECRVLSSAGVPVEGLFAAGADVGGVFGRRFAGLMAWALVSGRVVGVNAAMYVKS